MDRLRFYLVFIIGFVIYFYIDTNFFALILKQIFVITHSKALGHVATYSITLIPLFITVAALHKDYRNIPERLGISNGIWTGTLFALITTLPMLIGFIVKFPLNKELSFDTIIVNTISSAFFEEVIYRAFLFGQLYRYTRLGLFPSVFIGSLLFGSAHLYQGNDINELIGIFVMTFSGSVLFAWIYAEWKFNLWTAIFLHCFMNLYWLIFDVDTNVLGGTYSNFFRFSTIFIAIFCTVIYKINKQFSFEINRKTWWMKRSA